jgi:hypothetical protein
MRDLPVHGFSGPQLVVEEVIVLVDQQEVPVDEVQDEILFQPLLKDEPCYLRVWKFGCFLEDQDLPQDFFLKLLPKSTLWFQVHDLVRLNFCQNNEDFTVHLNPELLALLSWPWMVLFPACRMYLMITGLILILLLLPVFTNS